MPAMIPARGCVIPCSHMRRRPVTSVAMPAAASSPSCGRMRAASASTCGRPMREGALHVSGTQSAAAIQTEMDRTWRKRRSECSGFTVIPFGETSMYDAPPPRGRPDEVPVVAWPR